MLLILENQVDATGKKDKHRYSRSVIAMWKIIAWGILTSQHHARAAGP